ncbi:ThiF family adenylyltransferase [Rhizobium sp. LCM 4573]|uniref:ThiF family adenylyltransferase n=1 Tax=Rhizobium sp. LCM 4573 TaxID=1848291 RepID=UPI0008D97A80|nr:ThiF family adenylyltransferase [Rhizobium sp. LCM 4573]OHV78416.1 hypothetical protein LCM4573_26735 [Rhizobium sp. LCM 4573]
MLFELANHNPDIQSLLEKGYALRVDGTRLVVRDIPYLDSNGGLQTGAFVANLMFVDQRRVRQDDHQVYFAGSAPYGLDGRPIPNLGGGPVSIPLNKTDIVVQRSFSNKPAGGFPNFFEKIEHYVRVISGPAMERHGVTPFTFNIDREAAGASVFKVHDTLTTRAEIGDLSQVFKEEVVAIIGLGGTGSYLLDFMVKTPVQEIRAFDADQYYVHNAFRSPGRLRDDELGQSKAVVYAGRYENFRSGLAIQQKFIDKSSAADLEGVTFAFVCVDRGSARAEIFDLLISLGIPYIDVGMGLDRAQGALAGMVRATYYAPEQAEQVRQMQLAEMVDHPNDEYRRNVQVAELNALNACLAVIKYKQIKRFYVDDNAAYHMLMGITDLKTFMERVA